MIYTTFTLKPAKAANARLILTIFLSGLLFSSIAFLTLANVAHASQLTTNYSSDNLGQKESFNQGWLFAKDQQPNAEQTDFNDSSWRKVNLPHDWAIEGPFDPKYNARAGGLPYFGTGWYRKHFTLASNTQDKKVSITFDGAMYNAHVYVNGQFVGNRPFGYIGFNYDITEFLAPAGEENIIAVKLSPKNFASRWYPGAGIYRNTWIEINQPTHIAKWGTYITTPVVETNSATVAVETKVNDATSNTVLTTLIKDAKGHIVSEQKTTLSSATNKSANTDKTNQQTIKQTLTLAEPTRWDIDNPYLYEVVSQVWQNNKLIDQLSSPLGVRKIEFKPDDGLWLNDRRVQIQGVCLHHDNGPLGAIVNRRAIERKLEIMKSMGVNSVRTSHNPPSPELVELADKMGILLQVEAFDVWKKEKRTVVNGYQVFFDDWHEQDLRDMIIQHRNSPSIYMWSTGNEIMEQALKDGWKVAKTLTDIAKDEDPSRLVGAGFNNPFGAINNKLTEHVDIRGINYKPLNYEQFHKEHPEWLIAASETSSITSTRGIYHFPLEKYKTHPSKYVTSFDIIGPVWAYPPDIEFEYLAKTPAVMGEYMWTGFDYLGEPTPYGGRDHSDNGYWNGDWPVRSSSFGAVDLVGFPKDRYFLYQSQWTTKPMVHVLPHWNLANVTEATIPVFAYTNAEQVELFINGVSQGIKTKGVDKAAIPIDFMRWDKLGQKDYKSPYRLRWDVKYQAGELKVVAYTKGIKVAEKVIKTASKATKMQLLADRDVITADGEDLSYITINMQDKDGNFSPKAVNLLHFQVTGAGEIAAVGNGDSATLAPFQANYRHAFSGKAMLIVRGIKGQSGAINIKVTGKDLADANITIQAKATSK
ncbi:MAG: glycoside hydrolase family 2 TIM barrel-domain containing protein [Thalassotalea sp.]